MNHRAATAFPSTRQHARHFTDVSLHQPLNDQKAKNKAFGFGNGVARPFTTIGLILFICFYIL